MKRAGQLFLAVMCSAALVAVLASFGNKPVTAMGTAPVTVVNTPLPVSVANSPLPVLDAAPEREPFQTTLCTDEPSCPDVGSPSNTYSVPAGKKLVIEYVSGSCFTTPTAGRLVNFYLQIALTNHYFTPNTIATTDVARYEVVSQSTRLYAAAGSTVQFFTSYIPGGQPSCAASLSGYLQAIP